MTRWSPNHPAVQDYMRKHTPPPRTPIKTRILTALGLCLMIGTLPMAAWYAENDAPPWIALPSWLCVLFVGFGLASGGSRDDLS